MRTETRDQTYRKTIIQVEQNDPRTFDGHNWFVPADILWVQYTGILRTHGKRERKLTDSRERERKKHEHRAERVAIRNLKPPSRQHSGVNRRRQTADRRSQTTNHTPATGAGFEPATKQVRRQPSLLGMPGVDATHHPVEGTGLSWWLVDPATAMEQ